MSSCTIFLLFVVLGSFSVDAISLDDSSYSRSGVRQASSSGQQQAWGAPHDVTDYSLRGRSVFDVVMTYVRAHPEAARHVAERIIASAAAKDATLGEELRTELDAILNQPKTMATTGVCTACRVCCNIII